MSIIPKKRKKMMNKANNRDFSCELTGKILSKEKRKVYDKESDFYGNDYYRLKITNEEKRKEVFLFIYSNLVSSEIFQVIEQSNYVDKRYHFFCEKRRRGLILHNWRELAIISDFSQNKKIFKDRE
jgi:hypothetical protein